MAGPDAGASDVGTAGCMHAERVDGVCAACGHCLHEVILNGVCYFCGGSDIDPVAVSPKPAPAFVPASRLVRMRSPKDGPEEA